MESLTLVAEGDRLSKWNFSETSLLMLPNNGENLLMIIGDSESTLTKLSVDIPSMMCTESQNNSMEVKFL